MSGRRKKVSSFDEERNTAAGPLRGDDDDEQQQQSRESGESDGSNIRYTRNARRRRIIDDNSDEETQHRKKKSKSIDPPVTSDFAKQISQQSASLVQSLRDHEQAGSRLFPNIPPTTNPATPESLLRMSQLTSSNQVISDLLSGASASAGVGLQGNYFPLSNYAGSSSMLPTYASLASALASLNQASQPQPLRHAIMPSDLLQFSMLESQGLSSQGLPTNNPNNSMMSQQYHQQQNELDTIRKILVAHQSQPSGLGNLHSSWGQQQQQPQQQPTLTSMSILQLLASQYPQQPLHNINQLLQGGVAAAATFSNEPNYALGQHSLLGFSDRLGPSVGVAMHRSNNNSSNAEERATATSIQQFAPALSQLLGEPFASSSRGSSNESQQSSLVAAAGAVVEKASPHQMSSPLLSSSSSCAQQRRGDNERKQEDFSTNQEINVEVPESLPFIIGLTEDKLILNDHQVFLRQQIEVFRASDEDISTHTRGRTKPIRLGQIGIRCRHCAHLPISVRGRGSIYFPSQLMGIYQVAQNMAKLHFLGGGCSQIPPELFQRFQNARVTINSGVGRVYWTQAAKKVGLVDTEENCIRFVRDLNRQAR